jgi:transposase
LTLDWSGIRVSDGYGLYPKWEHRQTCLAQPIRKADALAERKKPDLRRFGENIAAWLRQLVSFAKEPPDSKQWLDFYTFFLFTIIFGRKIKPRPADSPVRSLGKWTAGGPFSITMASSLPIIVPKGTCVVVCCGENAAWAPKSEKGNRWVERILSMKETCRLKCKTDVPVSRGMYCFLFS